jgi:RNA ligase
MPFKAYEKMDGSLGICFFFNGNWQITTRGSFESEQGKKGQRLLEAYDTSLMDKTYTYLFEILCEESKVVVRYDKEELVLLGAIETLTGTEKYPEEIHGLPFRKPRMFEVDQLSDLNMTDDNFEGYVIKYDNGLRVKVKLDEYLRLHKLICGMTPKRLWYALMNGDDVEKMIASLPDELYKEVTDIVRQLRLAHGWEVFKHENTFLELQLDGMDRKEQAQKILSFCKENKEFSSSVFFNLLDKKEEVVHTQCWKMIEPTSNERIVRSSVED